MFTGIVQQVGQLATFRPRGSGASLVIRYAPWREPVQNGESIAVQGACLTVTAADERDLSFDVLEETLARTTLGEMAVGSQLNLERALRAADPLGGHIVTGHVDGVGAVMHIRQAGPDRILRIGCHGDIIRGIVQKGAIACDGVSLTVAGLEHGSFDVHIIPHTWTHTTLRRLRSGCRVNLETDVLGKYVLRSLGRVQPPSALTAERLRQAGFAS